MAPQEEERAKEQEENKPLIEVEEVSEQTTEHETRCEFGNCGFASGGSHEKTRRK